MLRFPKDFIAGIVAERASRPFENAASPQSLEGAAPSAPTSPIPKIGRHGGRPSKETQGTSRPFENAASPQNLEGAAPSAPTSPIPKIGRHGGRPSRETQGASRPFGDSSPHADAVPQNSFPPAADRAAWEGLLRHPLNRLRRDELIARAGELLGREQQVLPASGFSDFVRSGDRKNYEDAYYARRRDLAIHVLSTCFSPDPRTLDAALDIAWAICEETTWALPAHVNRRSPQDSMPDIRRPTLDIFACETAAVLAEALHLLRGGFDALSPVIAERIEGEIARRIIEPFETRDDFWWLSGENNWNPWCVSDILLASTHVIRDPGRLAGIICRCMEALGRFIARYPEDGCCDEGAMYWAASPGALLVALEALHELSGGRISIYGEPKIISMAQYIGHVHLGGGYCFNYSDCPPRLGAVAARVYRFGERIGDDSLKDLGLLALRGWQPGGEPDHTLGIGPGTGGGNCGALLRALRELFWIPADAVPRFTGGTGVPPVLAQGSASGHRAHTGGTPMPSEETSLHPTCGDVRLGHWYPEMQVQVARSAAESAPPMVLGFKGGTNGVNHNHNDVGSFVIQSSGCPVIVDVGNGTYTRQTFGRERYSMWWNAGRGHNVLQFGDHEQAAGAEFRAELIRFDDGGATVQLEFELAGAYPPGAEVESWRRSCLLKRGKSPLLTVTDSFRLRRPMEVKFPLFTPCAFDLGEGKAVFETNPQERLFGCCLSSPSDVPHTGGTPMPPGRKFEASGVAMTWDPRALHVASAALESDAPFPNDAWGTNLRRLICRIPGEVERAEYQFSFAPFRLENQNP